VISSKFLRFFINGEYDLNRDLFFRLEEGDRRGHDQKLFKKRFIGLLDIRKYAFCNRAIYIDNWNSLSAGCVSCNTIGTFKKHLRLNWNRELYSFTVSHLR